MRPARSPEGLRPGVGRFPGPPHRSRGLPGRVPPVRRARRTVLPRSIRCRVTLRARAVRPRLAGPRGWWRVSSPSPTDRRFHRSARRQRPGRVRNCRTPSRRDLPSNAAATLSEMVIPACWVIPRVAATASGTAPGSPTAANSISHTPSAKLLTDRAATSRASRVLPTPPTPVSVTSRFASTAARTSATSRLTPDERRRLRAQVARRPVQRPQRRELGCQTRCRRPERRPPAGQDPVSVWGPVRSGRHRSSDQPFGRRAGSARRGRRPSAARAVEHGAEVVAVA